MDLALASSQLVGKVALWMGTSTVVGALQMMIVRQRLPEVESAAYYMISRFAELSTYAGLTIGVVMFPLAAEAHAQKMDSLRILKRTMMITVGFGVLCAAGLAIVGRPMFGAVPLWEPYVPYVTDMVILSLSLTLCIAFTNFFTYEMAESRFGFLLYYVPVSVIEIGFVVCFTGYDYFRGILSDSTVDWMRSLNVASLRNFLLVGIAGWLVNLVFVCCQMIRRMNKCKS